MAQHRMKPVPNPMDAAPPSQPSAAAHPVNTAGAEAARLRGATDAGLTGDKMPASDPAAAPLGTDDEAAGQTASPAAIASSPAGHPADKPVTTSQTAMVTLGAIATVILLFLIGLAMVISGS